MSRRQEEKRSKPWGHLPNLRAHKPAATMRAVQVDLKMVASAIVYAALLYSLAEHVGLCRSRGVVQGSCLTRAVEQLRWRLSFWRFVNKARLLFESLYSSSVSGAFRKEQ